MQVTSALGVNKQFEFIESTSRLYALPYGELRPPPVTQLPRATRIRSWSCVVAVELEYLEKFMVRAVLPLGPKYNTV